jgi:hypothetical protein
MYHSSCNHWYIPRDIGASTGEKTEAKGGMMRNAQEQTLKESLDGKILHIRVSGVRPRYDEGEITIDFEILETEMQISCAYSYDRRG